jgi:hypothetical protein
MFSFRAVCDSLQIDPYLVRKWLLSWQAKRCPGEQLREVRRSLIPSLALIVRQQTLLRPPLRNARYGNEQNSWERRDGPRKADRTFSREGLLI